MRPVGGIPAITLSRGCFRTPPLADYVSFVSRWGHAGGVGFSRRYGAGEIWKIRGEITV